LPIPGTQLLYVTNTTANVFKLLTDQRNYVLLSGRWFRAPSLEGAWQFVPATDLPQDFARIPDSSPKENVKASVPGTPQARETFIANSIPQNAKVPRGSRMPVPQIDGEPKLASISETPLQYVVNSGTPIIRLDAHSWYACQDGVWYAATDVNGPWVVAESVPAVIYTIPASSPLHYVTYVRVYGSDQDYVYAGYTPGYMGTVIAPGDVVVFGTGYYYRPWIGSVWYGYPYTWGYGCDPFWSPWAGWSFGFGFGYCAFYPYYSWAWCPAPCWGPYRHWGYGYQGYHGGWVNTSWNVYRPATPIHAVASGTNWRGAYGRAYNSRTGSLVAGEHATVRNVFRTPPSRVSGAMAANRGVFAMRDGRVYSRDSSGRITNWRPENDGRAAIPTVNPSAALARESAARNLGQQHFNSFRAAPSAANRGGDVARAAPSRAEGGGSGGSSSSGRSAHR
jgi:hypothetical protein